MWVDKSLLPRRKVLVLDTLFVPLQLVGIPSAMTVGLHPASTEISIAVVLG